MKSSPQAKLAVLALAGLCAGVTSNASAASAVYMIHSFAGGSLDGDDPQAGLTLAQDGSIYGTTETGGSGSCGGLPGSYTGCGTVYRIAPDGTESLVYSFKGGSDGAFPMAGVAIGADGDLYGTTMSGGASNFGTVFRIKPDGTETVLHAFTNGIDGSGPMGGLTLGSDGQWYGTTMGGGTAIGSGTVFRISSSGVLSTLYSFKGGMDGSFPQSAIVEGPNGIFYGTTEAGGKFAKGCFGGCGTVFSLSLDGTKKTLYTFAGRSDGSAPRSPVVVMSDGSLYGTTGTGGGVRSQYCTINKIETGCGTVFRIAPDGTESIVLSFNSANGSFPNALTLGSDGNFYGSTQGGGHGVNCVGGCGTVYRLSPGGSQTLLYSFLYNPTGPQVSSLPVGGLVQTSDGTLYGASAGGGDYSKGTVFSIVP